MEELYLERSNKEWRGKEVFHFVYFSLITFYILRMPKLQNVDIKVTKKKRKRKEDYEMILTLVCQQLLEIIKKLP